MDKIRKQEYEQAAKDVPAVRCDTEIQKEAFTNVYYAACDLIGGLENIFYDYPEDDPEYIGAKEYLAKHQEVVDEIAKMALTSYYGAGFAGPMRDRSTHFAGKAFIVDCAEKVVVAMGY